MRPALRASVPKDRPGMAVVSRLPDGHYFITYEMIGPAYKSSVHARLSRYGWNFGHPGDLGFQPTDHAGEYFRPPPANVWARLPGSPTGALLLVGRTVAWPDGSQSPFTGRVLFINKSPDGTGPWTKIMAPVQVPDITKKVCQNYSSALLPARNGRSVLELAGKDAPDVHCMVYAGRRNLPAD